MSGFSFARLRHSAFDPRVLSDIRIPFRVTLPGLYTFRYHQDMGMGSFMGVDGPEFRPGNT